MIVDVSKSVVILSSAQVETAVNLQTTLPTVRMIMDVSKSVVILSSAQVDIAENLQTTSRTCRPHSPPCA
jgi:hypothetical protein